MKSHSRSYLPVHLILLLCLLMSPTGQAAKMLRLDCGPESSPVAEGYERLTSEKYTPERGYGWQSEATATVFDPIDRGRGRNSMHEELFDYLKESRDALNCDGVVGREDLAFRADLPHGEYRVRLTIGDMSQAIGSMDVFLNGVRSHSAVAAWTPGSYRGFDRNPAGWWVTLRDTVRVDGGQLSISVKRNQSYYDEQMAEQATWETPFAKWYHRTPVRTEPPYFYIGYPFVHNSVMAIEIVPYEPAPIKGQTDHLELVDDIDSPALKKAVQKYNAHDFGEAVRLLDKIDEPNAQVAKAALSLWLSGRLEVDMKERTLVPMAVEILRRYVPDHPEETRVAEMLSDAETFLKGWEIHTKRGLPETNHFIENDKAIGIWWTIQQDSPLYWKTRLHIGRAGHMLTPYFPCIGTVGEIFKQLESKFPDNRFVKYRLHGDGIFSGNIPGHFGQWEQYGDGTDYYDWVTVDYRSKARGAPRWVQTLYPAYAGLIDLSEWWIKFRQTPDGGVGGGTGDDVEIVGLFGYMGYISHGVSELCIEGTHNLVNGVWHSGAVDTERGYCKPMADAEHTAEWTGNTLGMMVQIDYGNPTWIERSLKTGILMRDLWTGINDEGRRQFKANFFGATQVGSGNRANDSWINYRAVRPAHAVLWYNQNPTISRLFVELAENWCAAAMSNERGKPRGIIPVEISWPQATVGGINSPNWYTANHAPGTVNYDFDDQRYKGYIHDLLITAYQQTDEERFVEPIEMEYRFAVKHGFPPEEIEVGRRGRPARRAAVGEPGTDTWVAANLSNVGKWFEVKRMIEGRKGEIEPIRTKEEIIKQADYVNFQLETRWPIMTTEAGPTDRIAFHGIVDPFAIYTGGGMGGPLLRAAVTYENTTKDFAAAVMAADRQGLRILYYSLAPDTREIGIVPWELEPGGTYELKLGIDENDDDKPDKTVETFSFEFPQTGSVVHITVEPRTAYIIEIEQTRRGRPPGPAADVGIASDDIRYRNGKLLVDVHNLGSLPVRDIEMAAYAGDPARDGKVIGRTTIDFLEPPNDLQPRIKTASIDWKLPESGCTVYVRIDPNDRIKDEITTFNNEAHALLPRGPEVQPRRLVAPDEIIGGRRGRR